MENKKVYVYNPLQRKNNIGRRTGKVISKRRKKSLTGNFEDYLSDSDEEKSINITQQGEKSIRADLVEDKSPEVLLSSPQSETRRVSTTKKAVEKAALKQRNGKNTAGRASEDGSNSAIKAAGRVRFLNPLAVGSRFGRRTGKDVLAGKSTPPANFSQYLSDASDISHSLLPTPERSSCSSPSSKVNQTRSATRGGTTNISPVVSSASLHRVSISSGPSPTGASDVAQSDAHATKIVPSDSFCVNNSSFQITETKSNSCNVSPSPLDPGHITDQVVFPCGDDNTATPISPVQVSDFKNETRLRTSTECLARDEDHIASVTRPRFGDSSHHVTSDQVDGSLLKVNAAQSFLLSHPTKDFATVELNNDHMKSVAQSGLNHSSKHLAYDEVDNNKSSTAPNMLTYSSKPLTLDKVANSDLTNVSHSLLSHLNKDDAPVEKDIEPGTRVTEPVSACLSKHLSTDEEHHSPKVAQPISSHSTKYCATEEVDNDHRPRVNQSCHKVDTGHDSRVAQPVLEHWPQDLTKNAIDTDYPKVSCAQPSPSANNVSAVEVDVDYAVSTSRLIVTGTNKCVATNQSVSHDRVSTDKSLSCSTQFSTACEASAGEIASATKPLLSHSLKHSASNEVSSDHTAGPIRPTSIDTIKSAAAEKVISEHAILANLNISYGQGHQDKSLLLGAGEHKKAPSSLVVAETEVPAVALTSVSSAVEVRPASVPVSSESSKASASLKKTQGKLIEPHAVNSQLGIDQKNDGQNLLPLPPRQKGNSSANSTFLKPAVTLSASVSILAEQEAPEIQPAKSSKAGQVHDTRTNVGSSRKRADVFPLDMNFGGNITGSVSHSEKAIPEQFYGIKKKLSFSSALVDNELRKEGTLPNDQARTSNADKTNNQRLSRQSIVASLCSSFNFRPELVSSRRESQILEQKRTSEYGLNDSFMSEEEFIIVEEEDKAVPFKVPGHSRRSQGGRPRGTSGRKKIQPPDEDDTTATVMKIAGEKVTQKSNVATRVSGIKGQEDLDEKNSKSLVGLKRKTQNARSASSKREDPSKVTEKKLSPLLNHHLTSPQDSSDNVVAMEKLNQIPSMDLSEAAHVSLESTNTSKLKKRRKSKQPKSTSKEKLQKIPHQTKLSKSIDGIKELAHEFNTRMVKGTNDDPGVAEKRPKLKGDKEDNIQSVQSFATIQDDQVKGNDTFLKQIREKRRGAVAKSLLEPEADLVAPTRVLHTTGLIQSPETGRQQIDQREKDVGNNLHALEEDNLTTAAVMSSESVCLSPVSLVNNLKTGQPPEKARRSLFSQSNLSVFTDNKVNNTLTESLDISAVNLTISKPEQKQQSVKAARQSGGRVRTDSNQGSTRSKPQKRTQKGRDKDKSNKATMKGQRKQETVKLKKRGQWLDCPIEDPPGVNTSKAQTSVSPHMGQKMNISFQNDEVVGYSKSQSRKRKVMTQSLTDLLDVDPQAPSENSPVIYQSFESSRLSMAGIAGKELSPNISKSKQTAQAPSENSLTVYQNSESSRLSVTETAEKELTPNINKYKQTAQAPSENSLTVYDNSESSRLSVTETAEKELSPNISKSNQTAQAPSENSLAVYQNLESSRLSVTETADKELSPNISKSQPTAGVKRRSRKISLADGPGQVISPKKKGSRKVSAEDDSPKPVGKKIDTVDKRKLAVENEIVEDVTPVKLRLLSSLPNLTPKSGISFRRSRKFSLVNDISRTQSVDAETSVQAGGAEENLTPNLKPSDTPVVLTSCLKKKTSGRHRKGRRVRISTFIRKREISLDESVNIAENSQDQTTLTSLLSPSASPVHYFDTTTNNYQSDTEITLRDLNYKIIQPTNSPHPGLRRSKRTRVMQLNAAKGERIVYRRDSTGLDLKVDRIQPSVVEAKLKAKEEERKKKLRQQKLRAMNVPAKSKKRLSVHVKMDEVVDNVTEIPVINPETSEHVHLELIGRSNSAAWYGPNLEPVTGSEPVAMCLLVRQPSFTTGDLHLRPLADKQLEETEHTLVFYVICGKIQLMIHEVTTTVETGDSFFVPRGTRYSLKNLRREVAKLHFIDINDANESRYITSGSFAAT